MKRYNYRNPDNTEEDLDNYTKIVDDFVESRKTLKSNLKKARGDIISMRVGEAPLTKDEKKSSKHEQLKKLNK